MKPITFAEQNSVADGTNLGVLDLPVHRDGGQIISCWSPTPEELQEIMATGQVWLCVMGVNQPPVLVTGHYPFEHSTQ